MKCLLRVVAALVSVVLIAQTSVTKYVVLAPKSTTDTATVSEGFAKNCPNVAVTENASKADYVLEALKSQQGLWHIALLSKDGDLLMATHFTHSLSDHYKPACKYINAKARQHNS
jgi:predicted solute-binding protein